MARTIQSASAHLMGVYPPNLNNNSSLEDITKILPPLKISEDAIKRFINMTPQRYESIAIHNNELERDTIYSVGYCPYLYSKIMEKKGNPNVWSEYNNHFKDKIYHKLSEYFKIPIEEINYPLAYYLGDALVSMESEGIISKNNFTTEEWKNVQRLQLPWSMDSPSALGTKIIVSKFFNPILEFMAQKIGKEYDKRLMTAFRGTEKYIFYSTHDLVIANFLKFFNPKDFTLDHIDYASNIVYELYQRDEKDEYYVKILYNNSQIHLKGCKNIDCDFEEFYKYFRTHGLLQDEVFHV